MHSWIGLWGAVLGLLFGITGFLLNHHAVLKIPAARAQESEMQLKLPEPMPADSKAWAQWLQKELGLERPANRVKAEPSRPVAWGNHAIQQPARWQASFAGPHNSVQAEYWVGNDFVGIKRSESNLWATLNNLHKGNGMGVGWVLLVDTLAGSIILLSLTGVTLWSLLNRRRLVGAGIAAASITLTVALALQAL